MFRVHPPAQVYGISFPAVTMHRSDVQDKLQADDSRVGLAPETFYHLHPFHFVVDMELRLIQAGSALSRLVPELGTPGCLVSDYLQVSPDPAASCPDSRTSLQKSAMECPLAWRTKSRYRDPVQVACRPARSAVFMLLSNL